MDLEIIKLGGTSLATRKDKELTLNRLKINKDKKYIIICSAMGRSGFPYATDTLDNIATNVNDEEKDRLLSCGEIISSIAFSSFLNEVGYSAISLSYLQIGITVTKYNNHLDSIELNKLNIISYLDKYNIIVVPGFIAKDKNNEVLTLGRGNSDLSAMLFADMFNIKCVTLFKDVEGIYPFIHSPLKNFIPYSQLSYEETKLLIESGSKVISIDALEYAKSKNIIINIHSYKSDESGTIVDNNYSDKKVIGFYVKEKTFDLITPYPNLIKEEMNHIFERLHIIIKKENIDKNHYYFKIDSSQLLLIKRKIIKNYFKNHIKNDISL